MHFARARLRTMRTILRLVVPRTMRIVHQHHALAFQQMAHRIQLQLDAEIANRLRRLDERAAHVMIADQRLAERQPGFRRIADAPPALPESGTGTTISASRRIFARQQTPQILARFLHRPPEHDRIRPRKIDVLEHALRRAAAPARSARASCLPGPRSPSRPARTSSR